MASSTADDATFINNASTGQLAAGVTSFWDYSSAGSANFVVNGTTDAGAPGEVRFFGPGSTAANATFTINPAVAPSGFGGSVQIDSTAANAMLRAKGANVAPNNPAGNEYTQARIFFAGGSSTGNATVVAHGGTNGGLGGLIKFLRGSRGGAARIALFGNGTLDVSLKRAPLTRAPLTIGSIEGDGIVVLGRTRLRVGSNNMDTTFSGLVEDHGPSGGEVGGSLKKIGRGELVLSGANTYTGGTIINDGTLLARNTTGSSTGTGPVQVDKGILGGPGKISGAVAVGNGTTTGATLLPATVKKPGVLTINNTLTFNSLSTYECVLNRATPAAAKVKALGVTINSNATFSFVDTTTGTLTPGTVFTIINNTSPNPIAGTFSNLPDGGTFTSNGTNFQASYHGGTGNDLTLTVQ